LFNITRFDDSASQSSGDSVLIGVEDQMEFKEYKSKIQVIIPNPYRVKTITKAMARG
jgi:hypothetical protein